MPVDFLCKAKKFEEFKLLAMPVLKRYFPLKNSAKDPDSITHVQWCFEFRKRNNDKIDKRDYVDWIMEHLEPSKTSISYDYADIEIIVEVFRDMLIMSAIPGYKRDFKKYNLQTLAGITGAGDDDENGEGRPTVNVAELIKRRKE